MTHKTPIDSIIERFFGGKNAPKEAWQHVYAYILGGLIPVSPELKSNLLGHNAFDKAVKGIMPDKEDLKDLKEALRSYYTSRLWRAVIVHIRGSSLQDVHMWYNDVDVLDIERAIKALSDDQYIDLAIMSNYISIYMTPQDIVENVLAKVTPTCHKLARSKMAWISSSDPGFDAFSELMAEAARVAMHYSHFPDPGKITTYVTRAIYNRCNHLLAVMSKPDRRRIKKLPELACPACKKEYIHPKHTWTGKDMYNRKLIPNIGGSEHYCPSCAKKGLVSPCETRSHERVYQTVMLSIDAPKGGSDGDNRSIGDTISGNMSSGDDHDILHQVDMSKLLTRLSPVAIKFLHILIVGDNDFDEWYEKRVIRNMDQSDPVIMADHICRYLGVPIEDIRKEIGQPIRPSIYLVRVDNGSCSDDDLVCAHTKSEAINMVARTYKYVDANDLKKKCGRVQVRCVDLFSQRHNIELGMVIPA